MLGKVKSKSARRPIVSIVQIAGQAKTYISKSGEPEEMLGINEAGTYKVDETKAERGDQGDPLTGAGLSEDSRGIE